MAGYEPLPQDVIVVFDDGTPMEEDGTALDIELEMEDVCKPLVVQHPADFSNLF